MNEIMIKVVNYTLAGTHLYRWQSAQVDQCRFA